MLEAKKQLLEHVDKLKALLSRIDLPHDFGLDKLKDDMEKLELFIPVVGAFSSGKSSLINSFLAKNYLAVAITPGTSLVTKD